MRIESIPSASDARENMQCINALSLGKVLMLRLLLKVREVLVTQQDAQPPSSISVSSFAL